MKSIVYNCNECNNDVSEVIEFFDYPNHHYCHICERCAAIYPFDKFWKICYSNRKYGQKTEVAIKQQEIYK